MKLSHSIDLTAKRAAAALAIDQHFESLAEAFDPTPTFHSAKGWLAHIRSPLLQAEATSRGMTIEALSIDIEQRVLANLGALMELDQRRREAKRQLEGLQSEQAIDNAIRVLTVSTH